MAGGALGAVAVTVAITFFLASAASYRLLVYPTPAHEVCRTLMTVGEGGFSHAMARMASEREAQAEAKQYQQMSRLITQNGIAGCEAALRVRGCGELVAHLCYRFGDVMDVIYWVAPRYALPLATTASL